MGCLWWLLKTLLLTPLFYLFMWNVIIVPMFGAGRTDFKTCFIVSIIINVICALYKFGKSADL